MPFHARHILSITEQTAEQDSTGRRRSLSRIGLAVCAADEALLDGLPRSWKLTFVCLCRYVEFCTKAFADRCAVRVGRMEVATRIYLRATVHFKRMQKSVMDLTDVCTKRLGWLCRDTLTRNNVDGWTDSSGGNLIIVSGPN